MEWGYVCASPILQHLEKTLPHTELRFFLVCDTGPAVTFSVNIMNNLTSNAEWANVHTGALSTDAFACVLLHRNMGT